VRLCILGATGNCGSRLVSDALSRGHTVTAVARDSSSLADRFPEAKIVQVDFTDQAQLVEAMHGHDVVINAAGYVAHGEAFTRLVSDIVDAAEVALGAGGRFWMFAGAALLDVPGTSRMTVSLPGVPAIYEFHVTNFEKVRASKLRWSVLCPGPLIDSPSGDANARLVISTDYWPVPRPAITRHLPWIATSLAFKKAMGRMTIYYEDAAKVILDNLDAPSMINKRVGIALPEGMSLKKPNY